MVNDFDKEIDAMMRDLAKGETFAQVLPASHLDADEISAFAENALPKMARGRATEHLADCSKCRKLLANTIFLNSAEESETIHDEVRPVVSAPVIPWYKRLFVAPNLAYAMGAMALLLVGMVGLLLFQNAGQESFVAKTNTTSEKESGPNVGSLEGDFPVGNSSANSNSAANAPSAMATPSVTSANSVASNVAVNRDASSFDDSKDSSKLSDREITGKAPAPEFETQPKKDSIVESPKAEPKSVKEEVAVEKGEERSTVNAKNVQDLPIQNRNNQVMMPDGQNRVNVQSTPATTATDESQDEPEKERSAPAKPNKKVATDREGANTKPETTRKVGNKSFRNVGGIWTDTSYSGGSTQNIRRTSDDFKKLDSGLQNTANSLGGTVIIVWAGKNYKIQ